MAKVAKVAGAIVGTIAGVALIASGLGAPIGAGILGASWSTLAAAGALLSTVGTTLQKKPGPPPVGGSASQIMIGANALQPYSMGRSYVGGVLEHDVGYGPTLKDVPNPYRSLVFVYSGAGPIDAIETLCADYSPIGLGAVGGYYSGFLTVSTQRGLTPEPSALAGPYGAIPGWSAAHKLSGYAASIVTMKFDKNGKVFSAGVPQFGAIGRWVWTYDPRLDSTYPGGSGTHRWDNELSWSWSENPALHALTYARGRYHNGKKVMGCGFKRDAIEVPAFVAWANVCDANAWKVGGTIYEPGSRWDNLKRICQAGSAQPVFIGARLSVKTDAPKVSLDTITADDLADGEYVVPAMKSWRDRINGIIPKYRSEAHKWEYVQSTLVSVASYVTEDGEEKNAERQYELVQNKDQAAQLAAYELVNARELGPIVLACKPRMIEYLPGEALTVNVPELGLTNQLCVIVGRKLDPASGIVELTLESETTSKHDFALGRTGTAPPTPSITTGQELDELTFLAPSIYRQDSDPAGANIIRDQDIWIDTSVEPIVMKVWVGGAWEVAANNVTQGTHIGVENGANVTGNHTSNNTNNVGWRSTAAVNQILTDVANGLSSLESSYNTLSAAFYDGTTGLAATRSRLINYENVTNSALGTQATRISGLESTVNDGTTGLVATRSRVGTLEQTVATNESTSANRFTLVESEIFNARGGTANLSARFTQEQQTTADALAGKASAQSVTDLTATVNGHTGRITTVESVTVTLEGKVNSSVTLLVDGGGNVAGYRINASNTDRSTFDVLAGAFRYISSGSPVIPFAITASEVTLNVPMKFYIGGTLRGRIG